MRKLAIAFATLLSLLACASSALASGKTVIDDCTNDEVMSRTYTQKEYRDALAQLPADADQYGNCRDIIARAQEAAATKGGAKSSKQDGTSGAQAGGGSGGGSGTPPPSVQPAKDQIAAASPADRAAITAATKDAATPEVAPAASDVGARPRSSDSDLPTPVLVLLALLLAGAIALAAVRVRGLVNARGA
jgi:hypothetical protein